MENELWATRGYLKATIQQLESTNEQYRCTNEELQSANEELQSTNEELETSREEIQSANEEQKSLNVLLQAKNDEAVAINDDLNNLLSSIEIAVIFLDNELRVIRFNQAATAVVRLIPADRGREFADISSRLDISQTLMQRLAQTVLHDLVPHRQEVSDQNGRRYALSIIPYRHSSNVIAGVVLTFYDITSQKGTGPVIEGVDPDGPGWDSDRTSR